MRATEVFMTLRASLSSILVASLAASGHAQSSTFKGWFSDAGCARARVDAGRIGPTGRECAQKQIASGAKVVFIDEDARRIWEVANPEAARGQESHYVRVVGSLDREAETLRVESVEVLSEYVASCRLPRRRR
jgi:hypothetical protein